MPHSQEGGPLVHGTGISFMRLADPVSFDPKDPEKWADLFFAIAADDPAVHLENIKSLMEVLQNEELLERLRAASCDEDLLGLAEEFGV
jgi:PTS system ascorbate-specific IIA component